MSSRSFASRLVPVVLLACAALWPAPAARGQAPYVDDRFPHLFAPRDPSPHVISIPQVTRPAAPRPARPGEPTRPPRGEAAMPAPVAPGAETAGGEQQSGPTTFVLVLGDNLAEWLAYGLKEALEDIPEVGITDRTRLSSGLARPEFHDWIKAIPEILASQSKVDFIVMMVGSNDRQPLRLEGGTAEPGTDRWREAYAQRVDQAMQAMKARSVPVYWVGMPPLRSQRTSAHMAELNAIFKERAEKNGVTYIDVWNGFVDEHGNYTQFGPDFAGQVRRLRTGDGVHFTAAGARKLALFVEQELRRDLLGRLTPAAPGAPSEPVSPAPEAALPGEPPPARPRPLAGPVLPLFGNPVIPAAAGAPQAGGPVQLAGERPGREPQGIAASVLVRGEAPLPVPGRADDFRWPRERAAAPASASSAGSVPP